MTDTAVQFASRLKGWEARHIRENPSNHNVITQTFANKYGSWADPAPWCAETITVIAQEGGVLPESCASAGAWDLTDRMNNAGLGRTLDTVHFPAVISYNYGSGHCGFLLGLSLSKQWGYSLEGNTSSGNTGNEGDGLYYRTRWLGGSTIHGLADLVFASAGKPVDRFLRLTNPQMRGQDVKNIQHALNVAGNHLAEDGVYGLKTGQTVNLFNHNHHIKDAHGADARGVVPGTWATLRKIVHS